MLNVLGCSWTLSQGFRVLSVRQRLLLLLLFSSIWLNSRNSTMHNFLLGLLSHHSNAYYAVVGFWLSCLLPGWSVDVVSLLIQGPFLEFAKLISPLHIVSQQQSHRRRSKVEGGLQDEGLAWHCLPIRTVFSLWPNVFRDIDRITIGRFFWVAWAWHDSV